MLQINPVTQLGAIEKISAIAKEVFHEVYDSIVPFEFTEQFIQKNQSVIAITDQINNQNFNYYFLNFNTDLAGYIGFQKKTNKIILSKFYILKKYRSNQLGVDTLAFIINFSKKNNYGKIELVVNQKNEKAIKFYSKNNFKITEEIENIMPLKPKEPVMDYKMVLQLS